MARRTGPFTTKSKVVIQSTLLTPTTNRFARALPPRGSRDPLRLAEGGALPYKGARHCPDFSLWSNEWGLQGSGVGDKLQYLLQLQTVLSR